MSTPSTNVGDLLEALCRNLHRDFFCEPTEISAHQETANPKLIKRCKSLAFEVLLRKSNSRTKSLDENADPSKELQYCQFEWKLEQGFRRSLQFGNYGFTQSAAGKIGQQQNALLEKSFEFLDVKDRDGEHMPILVVLAQLNNLAQRRQNRNELRRDDQVRSNSATSGNSRKGLLKFNPEISHLKKVDSFLSTRPRFKSMHVNYAKPLATSPSLLFSRSLSSTLPTSPNSHSSTFYASTSWDQLGEKTALSTPAPHQKPFCQVAKEFASDSKHSLFQLNAVRLKANHCFTPCRVVSMQVFIPHIKSLVIAIESESFTYNEDEGVFEMIDNITVDDIRSSTNEGMLQEFIECGSCYKRIKLLIGRDRDPEAECREHSYLFAVMCKTFDKYLETFRRTVVFVKDNSILQLSLRLAPLFKQIRNLAKVLAIHPSDINRDIPSGSKFLGYLYKLTTTVTQKDVSLLLLYVLTECCEVYFRNFENWIYQGIINDACRDLFIGYINDYRPTTKYFFERAHFIKKESIPGFLAGYEDLVLLCGKYTNLLKSYRPTHPIFEMRPIPISICLSFSQIEQLERNCRDYVAIAEEVCGPPILACEVFKQDMHNATSLSQLSKDKLQEHIQKWRDKKISRKVELRAEAEKERLVLLEQIEENRNRILRDRRKEIDLERKNEAIQNEMEMEALLRENVERKARLERLTELEQFATSQWERAEDKVRALGRELNERNNDTTAKVSQIATQGRIESMANNNLVESLEMSESDKNCNDLLSDREDIVDEEDIQLELLDTLNCNSTDIKTDTDAVRNRNHMKASSIVFGDLYVKTTNSLKEEATNLPTDENLNTSKSEKEDLSFKSLSPSQDKVDITVELPPSDSPMETVKDINESTPVRPKMQPNLLDVEFKGTIEHREKSHLSPNRSKLRSSLSLDLQKTEDKDEYKACNTPMSTTSDNLIDAYQSDLSDLNASRNSSDEFASAEGSPQTFTNAVVSPNVTPSSKNLKKPNSFTFVIRELSEKHEALQCMPSSATTPIREQKITKNVANVNPAYTFAELRDLNITNLTNFLQQSFELPLYAHFSILNNEILKIFLNDLTIFSHFNSLRNYFLMMDSEFANIVFTGLVQKLETINSPSELLNSSVLHSILGNALHSNVAAIDKNADNLSFAITNVPKEWNRDSPDVFNPIMLIYQVDWPLNLVLSGEMIDHYGVIFQYLIKLRRISWLLEQCFFKLKYTRKQSAEQILKSQQYCHVQQIRHKLLCFINGLQSHVNTVALQSSWDIFCEELKTIKSLEEICRSHAKYLNRIGFLCMLTKKSHDFLSKIEKVFCTVIRFTSQLNSRNWRCDDTTHTYIHPKYSKLVQIEKDFHTLIRYIIHAGKKMCDRGFQTEIGEFVSIININGWYDQLQSIKEEQPVF